MITYMIGYDLNRPGQDYKDLFVAIQKFENWWHCLASTWIITTTSTAVQVREYLAPYLDAIDKLLVARLSADAAWQGFDEKCSSWLKNNL
ncbi:MAG: SinR family protein [Chthonomonadaceae bacterium]|nr:SinR family protein [Chthonomonadaceae bacterium]